MLETETDLHEAEGGEGASVVQSGVFLGGEDAGDGFALRAGQRWRRLQGHERRCDLALLQEGGKASGKS